MKIRTTTVIIVIACFILGICFTLSGEVFIISDLFNAVLLDVGIGLISAAIVSIIFELIWGRERIKNEQMEFQPYLNNIKESSENLMKKFESLEGRLEAFKQLGLNYCTASRKDSLSRFYNYAKDALDNYPESKTEDPACVKCRGMVKLVASSSRGIIGYLDREPQQEIQKDWRNLIIKHAANFCILLTHPAYAHLRQPAEERSTGDIEMEVLKTAIYLHFVAGMKSGQLRLYRGSPTSFLIKIGGHILLNPYPYGKMAMETLCLEFESENESSYASQFASMHFDHTWAFHHQNGKLVDGKMLVVGIDSFDDILNALAECTFLGDPKTLRLTYPQITELDTFINTTIRNDGTPLKILPPPDAKPFDEFVKKNNLKCCTDSNHK